MKSELENARRVRVCVKWSHAFRTVEVPVDELAHLKSRERAVDSLVAALGTLGLSRVEKRKPDSLETQEKS